MTQIPRKRPSCEREPGRALSSHTVRQCFASLAMTNAVFSCDKSTRRANHSKTNHSKTCPASRAKIFRSGSLVLGPAGPGSEPGAPREGRLPVGRRRGRSVSCGANSGNLNPGAGRPAARRRRRRHSPSVRSGRGPDRAAKVINRSMKSMMLRIGVPSVSCRERYLRYVVPGAALEGGGLTKPANLADPLRYRQHHTLVR